MFIQIQLDSFHIPGLKVKGLNGQNIMDQSEDEGIWIVIEFWPIFTIQVVNCVYSNSIQLLSLSWFQMRF